MKVQYFSSRFCYTDVMTFTIRVKSYNLISFMRLVGYQPLENTAKGELNCVRPLGGTYPRFHAYVSQNTDGSFIFNLHLDQKKASYEGSHAHNGEYEGETILEEKRRIEYKAELADGAD